MVIYDTLAHITDDFSLLAGLSFLIEVPQHSFISFAGALNFLS